MRSIECPAVLEGNEKSLFIAGGISGCDNWQEEFINSLKDTDLTILNPRRNSFKADNLDIEEEQISWEFNHLKKVSAVSFWFPKETLCPITLYELGKQSVLSKPLFVGVHPEYKRKRDIEIQTRLIRPEIKIVYSLSDLVQQVRNWIVSLENI